MVAFKQWSREGVIYLWLGLKFLDEYRLRNAILFQVQYGIDVGLSDLKI